jgi:hypothetical protein
MWSMSFAAGPRGPVGLEQSKPDRDAGIGDRFQGIVALEVRPNEVNPAYLQWLHDET